MKRNIFLGFYFARKEIDNKMRQNFFKTIFLALVAVLLIIQNWNISRAAKTSRDKVF